MMIIEIIMTKDYMTQITINAFTYHQKLYYVLDFYPSTSQDK